MGKILGLLIGTIAAIAGVGLLGLWRSDVLSVIRGILPGMLIFGGVIAVVSGFSEFKDVAKSKKENK